MELVTNHGPPGEQGPQGPPGPTQQFTFRTTGIIDTEVPSETEKTIDVFCQSDETAISGSFGIVGNMDGISSLREGLNDSNGYFVDILNNAKESRFIEVYVTCAKLV